MGNRLIKDNRQTHSKQIYIRDAQGNVMAVYQARNDSLFLDELHLYGSSRLGMIKEQQFLTKKQTGYAVNLPALYQLKLYNFGKKRYELADWLGNVRVVINDKKTPMGNNTQNMTYAAQVLEVNDYYPFGMLARNYNVDKYRYGFQGQEGDSEIKGEGNSWNYKFRMQDPRLGRFFSVDPLFKKYPYYSSYQFGGNQVISTKELEGAEPETDLNATVSFNLTIGTKGQSYLGFSAGIGMSAKQGSFMTGLNLSLSAYNGGLGTTSGTTGTKSFQLEGALSAFATLGTGTGKPLPLSTFHSNVLSSASDKYKFSFTTGQNFAFSKRDGYHRVASTGVRLGPVSLMTYNDVVEPKMLLFGGGTDESWTGGGVAHIGLGNNYVLSIGNDVFTGRRPDKNAQGVRPTESGPNPKWLYYKQPSQLDYNLNNGQTFIQLSNMNNLGNFIRIQHSGKLDMFTQDLIHGTKTPHFKSDATNSWQIRIGVGTTR